MRLAQLIITLRKLQRVSRSYLDLNIKVLNRKFCTDFYDNSQFSSLVPRPPPF